MSVISRLDTRDAGFRTRLKELLAFEASEDASIEQAVQAILADVRARGDAAVLEYTERFDRHSAASIDALEIPFGECQAALDALPSGQRDALEQAAARIRSYHEHQVAGTWSYTEAD